ncbi:hypothetical protein GF373_06800, partial [bacterium]|nr:hypothetical protein [bacterium]
MMKKILVFVLLFLSILTATGWLLFFDASRESTVIPDTAMATNFDKINMIEIAQGRNQALILGSKNQQSQISLFDLKKGKPSHRLFQSTAALAVTEMGFSADRTKAIAIRHNHAEIWDLATGQSLRKISVEKPLHFISGKPNTMALGTQHKQQSAVIVDAQTNDILTGVQLTPQFHTILAFSPDGKLALATYKENESDSALQLGLYETAAGKLVKTFPGKGLEQAIFSPGSRYLLIHNSPSKQFEVWGWESDSPLHIFKADDNYPIWSCKFSYNNHYLLIHGQVWDLKSGELLGRLSFPDTLVTCAAFSKDNLTGLAGCQD